MVRILPQSAARRGITLTEILIAIMILGVGLVSLATLFPIGLLKLRDANRYSRSAYLVQSAASDVAAFGLLNKQTFGMADMINFYGGFPYWYAYPGAVAPNQYDPFTQDTPTYGGVPYVLNQNGTYTYLGAVAPLGSGLPVAYDPLWRFQTGIYLDPVGQSMPEARFGDGQGFIRNDPTDGGIPSVWGLQRLTNFNRPLVSGANGTMNIMNHARNVPGLFVSPEDVVWNEESTSNVTALSPVLPELNLPSAPGAVAHDWRYSWMITVAQTNTSLPNAPTLSATFDGNLVIWENRPFGIETVATANGTGFKVQGETVVEAVFGYSTGTSGVPGYGVSGADRTVLLRWPASQEDPVVKAGDWIADVTYERNQQVVLSRFLGFQGGPGTGGLPNPANNGEWDNLPAQRCFWYQVNRATPVMTDPVVPGYRSMVVQVNSSLQAKTVMMSAGVWQINAALIARNVVNVIPQTFFAR